MIGSDDITNIENFFREKKYNDLEKILLEYKKNSDPDNKLNIYYYFFYECTDQNESMNNAFIELKELYKNDISNLYYNLAQTCKNLFNIHLSYFTEEDVFRYYRLSIRENPKNSEAFFYLGKMLIYYKKNVKEGIKLIKKSFKENPNFKVKTYNFIKNLEVVNHYIKTTPYYTKRQIIQLSGLLDIIPESDKDYIYYIQRIIFYTILEQYDYAEKQINNINTKNKKDYKYRKALYFLYFSQRNYINALKYSKNIEKAVCYEKLAEYGNAIKIYKQLLKKRKFADYYLYNLIAKAFLKMGNTKEAKEFIKKNLQKENGRYDGWVSSLIILSDINSMNKAHSKSILNLKKAETLIDLDTLVDNKEKIREEIIFKQIVLYSNQHILLKKKAKIPSKIKFKDIESLNNYIKNLSFQIIASTFPKEEMIREIERYLKLPINNIKEINKIEKKVNKSDSNYNLKVQYKIRDAINSSMSSMIIDSKVLFRLAQIEYNIGEYNNCIKHYKSLLKEDPYNSIYLNNLAIAYREIGDEEKAIRLIKNSVANNKFGNNLTVVENMQNILYEKQKNNKTFSKDFDEVSETLIYRAFTESSALSKRTNNGLYNIQNLNIYKYKSFNINTIDSIINQYFYFSEITKLNDPLDIPIIEMSNNHDIRLKKINQKDIKILSLSLTDINTLMWSHYADSHKGICIGYKVTSLPSYIGWDYIKYLPDVYDYKRMSRSNGFLFAGIFSKHINWEYEKEIRLVTFKKNNKISYKYPINPLDNNKNIEGYISEIIIGYKFEKNNIEILKPIICKINKYRDRYFIPKISLYKMEFNPEYPLSLIKRKYI